MTAMPVDLLPGVLRACPNCQARNSVPILYGLRPLDWRVRHGRAVLGGCVIAPGMPTRSCRSCGTRFGRLAGWRLR